MFSGRKRTLVTITVVIEGAIAGWAVGGGWLGLLAMVAAVTAADSVWGLLRRRAVCDVAGIELAACLAILLVMRADLSFGVLTACACASWLVLPDRYLRVTQPGEARTRV
jgi:hypothetical protein